MTPVREVGYNQRRKPSVGALSPTPGAKIATGTPQPLNDKAGSKVQDNPTKPRCEAQTRPMVFAIRAEYVRRILAGSKRWEFRKSMPRFTMGDRALIYESRGRGRIVAVFTVGSMVYTMSPGAIWRTVETMDPGSHGIDRPAFLRYFEGRDAAVAFGVESVVPLDLPLPEGMSVPQSWVRWKGDWPLPVGSVGS